MSQAVGAEVGCGLEETWLAPIHPANSRQFLLGWRVLLSEPLFWFYFCFLGFKSIYLAVTALICTGFIIENPRLCASPMQSDGFKAAGGN